MEPTEPSATSHRSRPVAPACVGPSPSPPAWRWFPRSTRCPTPPPAEAAARRRCRPPVGAPTTAAPRGARRRRSSTVSWSRSRTAAQPTPSVPESTSPTTPTTPARDDADHAGAGDRAPGARTRRRQRRRCPGRRPRNDGGAVAPVPSGPQAFSSVGGSIVVAVNGSSISLASNSPAAGFGAEVHDNGPTPGRGAVHQWRHRVAHPHRARRGGLTSEITQHG